MVAIWNDAVAFYPGLALADPSDFESRSWPLDIRPSEISETVRASDPGVSVTLRRGKQTVFLTLHGSRTVGTELLMTVDRAGVATQHRVPVRVVAERVR